MPGLVALAAIGLAPAAGALNITGLGVTLDPANTPDAISNTGNNRSQIASSTGITLAPSGPVPDSFGSTISFATRYASVLAADREGPVAGSTTASLTSAYTITFTVDNPTAQPYQIDIDTLRVGALTWVDDDATVGATSSATLGALTGSVDSIAEGAFSLAAVGPTATGATSSSAFSQNGTTLTINDNALGRTFTLSFTWAGTVTSDNDEVAIRMGTSGGLGTTTADDYPGADVRTAANDGHFVDVTVTMLPEPSSGALLGMGLLGLGIRNRVIRRSRAARGA